MPRRLRPLRLASPLATVLLAAACGSVNDPATPDGRPADARPDGGAAAGDGHITYTLGGDIYRLAGAPGAVPENVSAQLAPGERADDRRLNLSPNGSWYIFETSNLDPSCALCLAIAPLDDLGAAELVAPDDAPIPAAENLSAVDDQGVLVVFAAGGGPHARDLYRTRREGSGWASPVLLTADSSFAWNDQPALHPDGTRLLFDCGPEANASGDGARICEVDTDGGAVTVVASAADAPSGTGHAGGLHHADYAPAGIVFEADWDGERVWRKVAGAVTALTPLETSNDNSPCVLPDGRVASLYLNDPGNPESLHELKVMGADGDGAMLLVRGVDIADSGLGCGQ